MTKLFRTIKNRFRNLIDRICNHNKAESETNEFRFVDDESEWTRVYDERIDFSLIDLNEITWTDVNVYNPWKNSFNGFKSSLDELTDEDIAFYINYLKIKLESEQSKTESRNIDDTKTEPESKTEPEKDSNKTSSSNKTTSNNSYVNIYEQRHENHKLHLEKNLEAVVQMVLDENPELKEYSVRNDLSKPCCCECYIERNMYIRAKSLKNKNEVDWNFSSESHCMQLCFFDPVDLFEIYSYEKTDNGYIPKLKCTEEEHERYLESIPMYSRLIGLNELNKFMKEQLIRTDYMVIPKKQCNDTKTFDIEDTLIA